MLFDDLDSIMRVYETQADFYVLPEIYMVARLDGRGFTKFTQEQQYKKPFDSRFMEMMVQILLYVFEETGFSFSYGYLQSDEISLLFKQGESSFNRKTRKLDSILASAAAGKMSLMAQTPVMFDSRISQLPTVDRVVDYFRWRQMDAERNALSSYAYWTLRKEGLSARQATRQLDGATVAQKNELLFVRGINFNDVSSAEKRGFACYYTLEDKEGFNPITKESVFVKRNLLTLSADLPIGDKYSDFVIEKARLLTNESTYGKIENS